MLPYTLLVMFASVSCKQSYQQIVTLNNLNNLSCCIENHIHNYYKEKSKLTFVDMDFDDEEVLKAIHQQKYVSVVSRNPSKNIPGRNEGYFIIAADVSTFVENVGFLSREAQWEPQEIYLIIIKNLHKQDIQYVLNKLLSLHIFRVILVNGTNDANMFSYNPFDNNGCGKRYDKIISLGKCLDIKHEYIPRVKRSALHNCTVHVILPQWPPYSIQNGSRGRIGVDQFVLSMMGQLEGFIVNYTFIDFANDTATVSPNMTATRPLNYLQNNEADVVMGGLLLEEVRGAAFNYLCGHLAYTDEMVILVRSAGFVPLSMNLYLEFSTSVWILLLVTFLLYTALVLALFRFKNIGSLILKLWDNLFLHGSFIQCKFIVKCVLIAWVWFTYLINTYYQTGLMSLTTNPYKDYQISDEDDLLSHNIKPCISSTISKFLLMQSKQSIYEVGKDERCSETLSALEVVSSDDYPAKVFTVAPQSIYSYNQYQFNEDMKKPNLYVFEKPLFKMIDAIYLYKGFPLKGYLNLHTLRLRENGLVDHALNELFYKQYLYTSSRKQSKPNSEQQSNKVIVPWLVLVIGCSLSIFAFVLEVLAKSKLLLKLTACSKK